VEKFLELLPLAGVDVGRATGVVGWLLLLLGGGVTAGETAVAEIVELGR
jgi:hypothetical protein